MSRALQVPATLEGVSTLKDGGLSVRLHTQELTSTEKAVAMDYQGKFGYFLFKESEHDSEEVDRLEDIRKDLGGKSPSQRLRSVLFVLFKQIDNPSVSFEQFYDQRMESIINQVKERLD